MRINSINLTNFNGLWGKTVVLHSGTPDSPVVCREYHYYPFLDEDEEQVERTVLENTRYSNYVPDYKTNGYYAQNVTLHAKLPFTKKDYSIYKAVRSKVYNKELYDNFSKEKEY